MWSRKTLLAGCSLALLFSPAALGAEEHEAATIEHEANELEVQGATADVDGEELSGPMEDVQEAAEILQQMRLQEADLAALVDQAKGVFIVPDYATGSLLIGGSGGEGVLMVQQDGEWGSPGFYDIGNIDVGAQAGVAVGSLVMLLMSDEAVDPFLNENDFSLTAQAGLTIINWSAQVPATSEDGDVMVWTDTEGLLAEASVGVGGMSWDEEEAGEYYGQEVMPAQVLAGEVQSPHDEVLKSEFAQFGGQAEPVVPEATDEEVLVPESAAEEDY